MEMIIRDVIPAHIVEKEGFRNLIQTLDLSTPLQAGNISSIVLFLKQHSQLKNHYSSAFHLSSIARLH